MNVSYCHICTCKCLSLHGLPPRLPHALSSPSFSRARRKHVRATPRTIRSPCHESYDLHVDKLVDYLRCTKVSIGEPRALYARSYTLFSPVWRDPRGNQRGFLFAKRFGLVVCDPFVRRHGTAVIYWVLWKRFRGRGEGGWGRGEGGF